nr:FBD-associated F-box protein At5g60610-like [Quercus suber]POF14456.1 f-box/fbd/lrr-repeat protein [Quercus suber]
MADSSQSEEKAVGVDRISDLPDCVLIHIVSFLPFNQTILTSLLSTRWKPLWTYVPILDIRNNYFPRVSRVLALLQFKAPFVQTFRMFYNYSINPYQLDRLVTTVTTPNLKVFDLRIHSHDTENYWALSHSILSCKSLVVLKLAWKIDFHPLLSSSLSFQLPRLKILRFKRISFRNCNSLTRLLSACPVLEQLSLKVVSFPKDVCIKIWVPTLKLLRITYARFDSEFPVVGYKYEIDAPSLEYFEFGGPLGDIIFLGKLDNLIEARLHIWSIENDESLYDLGLEMKLDRVFNLLVPLNKLKFLSFSYSARECRGFGSFCSMFQNLVRLDFTFNNRNWDVLQALLRVAPNLRVLFFKKSSGYGYHRCHHWSPAHVEEHNQLCSSEPPKDPNSLSSHLTTFYFRGYNGIENEVEFVKFILKESRLLKTMTVEVDRYMPKEGVLEELSMFPRSSSTCLLTVKGYGLSSNGSH